MNAEKFEKEYAYSILYSYGKEGKRVANSAYGCHKILNDNLVATRFSTTILPGPVTRMAVLSSISTMLIYELCWFAMVSTKNKTWSKS